MYTHAHAIHGTSQFRWCYHNSIFCVLGNAVKFVLGPLYSESRTSNLFTKSGKSESSSLTSCDSVTTPVGTNLYKHGYVLCPTCCIRQSDAFLQNHSIQHMLLALMF